jgi:hypothetical protein
MDRSIWRHPDDEAADDVDGRDDEAGDGVAADEAAGAVHGAVEVGLAGQLEAARARLVLGDEAGGEVAVDAHLLAGQGVEGEAGAHLGDAAGAARDDDEVDEREDEEDHDADDIAAADDELAEGADDLAGGVGAVGAPRRMRRVVATLSERRKSVVIRSSDGNTEKSRGRVTWTAVRRITSEIVTLTARRKSSASDGSGTIISPRMPTSVSGIAKSRRRTPRKVPGPASGSAATG